MYVLPFLRLNGLLYRRDSDLFRYQMEEQSREYDLCSQEKFQINHSVKREKNTKTTTKMTIFTEGSHPDFTK